MKKRNLILVHLESLSWQNFRLNRDLFPNLYSVENRAISFSRYFSSATSTIMVMTDLAFGSFFVNEKSRTPSWEKPITNKKSFMEIFRERGYSTRAITLSNDFETIEIINKHELIGKSIVLEKASSVSSYREYTEETVDSNCPFILWLSNNVSHVSINDMIGSNVSVFVAKYKYTKLQDQKGQCCMSKKDKVASLTPE